MTPQQFRPVVTPDPLVAHDVLLWVAVETTGLDPEHHALLETTLCATDIQGNIVVQPATWTVYYEIDPHATYQDVKHPMSDVVKQRHTTSGLLAATASSTLSYPQQAQQMIQYARYVQQLMARSPRHKPRLTLAGRAVQFAKTWLTEQSMMDEFFDVVHHQVLDLRGFITPLRAIGWKIQESVSTHRTESNVIQDITLYQQILDALHTATNISSNKTSQPPES